MSDKGEVHRRSTRLPGYDYAQPGGYFVTICTRDRILFFDDKPIREIVESCWSQIPDHFPNVELDQWVIMPNHIHGIILIHDPRRGEAFPDIPFKMKTNAGNASPVRHPKGTTPRSLNAIIQNFKSVSTRKINHFRNTPGQSLWQRGFYDRIIRNEKELDRIRKYISDNPLKWELDPYHPRRHG
jgi:REP element-mobilizing transposase RayT